MSTNQQPVSKVPSTAPVTNGDSKVPISKPLSQQPKKSDSEVEDEEEGEVEYEEEEVEVDEEYDEDYEIEEVEVDDDGEEDLEEPTEADAEELEDDDVTNDEFDRVGSKIDELLAKTGTLQSSLNGSASLASKAIAETATKPEPAKIPEISAVKIVQSPVKPAEVVKVEEVEDEEEEVEYVYEDEEEEEEPEKVPGKIETKQETKTETKPEEEPVKVVPQIVFKPKVPEKVLEEEEEEELEDEEVEYVYEDEEEEEEEAPPAGNLLRHASNNWNICDLKDDAEICLQTQDGSFNNKVVEAMPISELDQSKSKQPELNQSESSQPISNVSRPLVIQSEEEEEEEDIEEIEIALEEGMEEEEDDDDEVDEQMPDNLLRDPSSSINKSPVMDHYQIDLPPMSPSPTPNSAKSPGSPGFPSGLTTGSDQQKYRQSRSPSPSPGRRSLSPASQILSRVRNLVLLGQLAPLQQLLDSTPNFFIDAILKAGWTALMYGSYRGYPAIVDFCLKRGSDPNYHKEFFTSLMAVCTSVSADESQLLLCMKLLLSYGARVNAVDKFGCSPLHYAARFGRAQLIRCLLSYGANLNHTNQNGWSALHWAAAENQTDAIGELLDRNIDVHLKTTNPEAMTASELAAMKKNFEVAEALGEMEQEDLIAKQQQQQQQQQQSKPEPKSDSVGGSSVDDDEQQFKLKQDKIDSIISQAFESAGNRFTKIQEEDEDEVEAEAEAEEVEVKVKLEQEQEIKESEQCKMEQISQSSSQPEQSPLTNNNISEFKEQEEEDVLNRPRFSAKLESDPMSDIVAQLQLPPESDALWCRDSIQLDQSPISSPSFFATTTGHLVLTCILFVLLKFLYSKLFSQSVTDAK